MTLALLTTKTHHNNTKDDGKWGRTKKYLLNNLLKKL